MGQDKHDTTKSSSSSADSFAYDWRPLLFTVVVFIIVLVVVRYLGW